MVLPITGPTVVLSPEPWLDAYRHQRKYTQAMPVDRPLDYDTRYAYMRARVNNNTYTAQAAAGLPAWSTAEINPLTSVSYDKLKSKISDRASIGAALAELPQAVQMITNRLHQVRLLTKAIRKGRLGDAFEVLGQTYGAKAPKGPRTFKSSKNDWASRYLEFHFGWSPMIGDIYDSIEVLQNPIKDVDVSASAKSSWRSYQWSTGTPGSDQNFWKVDGIFLVRHGLQVSVSNPNLWLANQLGLINPLQIAWEVVPFSFVVDWFVNVEQFLGLGTDFLGLVTKNGYTTKAWRGPTDQTYVHTGFNIRRYARFDVGYVERRQGITLPSLTMKPFKLWGWRRAAAAASLLTQVFSRR